MTKAGDHLIAQMKDLMHKTYTESKKRAVKVGITKVVSIILSAGVEV